YRTPRRGTRSRDSSARRRSRRAGRISIKVVSFEAGPSPDGPDAPAATESGPATKLRLLPISSVKKPNDHSDVRAHDYVHERAEQGSGAKPLQELGRAELEPKEIVGDV